MWRNGRITPAARARRPGRRWRIVARRGRRPGAGAGAAARRFRGNFAAGGGGAARRGAARLTGLPHTYRAAGAPPPRHEPAKSPAGPGRPRAGAGTGAGADPFAEPGRRGGGAERGRPAAGAAGV